MHEWLMSTHTNICRDHRCREAVKVSPHGGYYITMMHSGYNSPTNNRMGYATKAKARAYIRKLAEGRK